MENFLKGLRVYLSGPIEFCEDAGTVWRDELTPFLEELGLIVLDPTKMSNDIPEAERVSRFTEMRKAHDWEGIKALAKNTRRFDLRLIDACDFVIALVDQNISMCGTWEELAMAVSQRKPILLVWTGTRDANGCYRSGLQAMNSWGFAQFQYQHVFSTFQEVRERLTALNDGSYPMDDKWVVFEPGGFSRVPHDAPLPKIAPTQSSSGDRLLNPYDLPNADYTDAQKVYSDWPEDEEDAQ